jgi:5-(carboxyamino)imidazole ribonucleotide synthase
MVGAGQLARMTHQAAVDLGVRLEVLADRPGDPAVVAGARYRLGDPTSWDDLVGLARDCDVVTFDHERVPARLATELGDAGYLVRPTGPALLVAQDKLFARTMLGDAGFPVPLFRGLGTDPVAAVRACGEAWGWPVVCKTVGGGYDGRGVAIVGPDDAGQVLSAPAPGGWMAEARVDIAVEVAVVGVRSPSGRWAAYPLVETVQRDGICTELVMPARVPPAVADRAMDLAEAVAEQIGAVGIVAVELFVTTSGDLVVNELALRPHNSGHATIEGCVTSQFENHLRAVLDLPLGATGLVAPAVATVNVLGPADGSDPRARLAGALAVAGARVHLYDKDAAPGRKLGHVTALGADHGAALDTARRGAAALTGAVAAPVHAAVPVG